MITQATRLQEPQDLTAVAEYIDWYNHRRLHGEIGHVPPAEYEQAFWDSPQPNHYPQTPVLTEAGTT